MIGQTLGEYRIVEQIGMGGMATVFKAYDPGTDRYVAIKTLPKEYAKDPNFAERFRREAKAIAKLEHLHILPVFAYGEQEDTAYMVMRFLPTGTLAKRIRQGTLSFKEASRYLKQLASALDYAHSQGVIHRDIKPSNVLIDQDDNVFLTDFGIAKMVEGSTLDLTGDHILGTPQYMSPEQCMGEKALTPASDIYSLGIVLYEMVTGRAPFTAETPLAVIHMQLNSPLPIPRSLRPDLPDAAEAVILKALSKQPELRYPTCDALAQAFANAVTTNATPVLGSVLVPDTPTIAPSTMQAAPLDTREAIADTPTMLGDAPEVPLSSAPSIELEAGRSRRFPVIAVVIGIVVALGVAAGAFAGSLPMAAPPPTITPNPLATEIADASGAPSLEALRDGVVVRGGPGQDYDVLSTLSSGDQLDIRGISEDIGWYQIMLPDETIGWVAASEALVKTSGDLGSVPISLPPTAVPTRVPITIKNSDQLDQIAPLTGYDGTLEVVAFSPNGKIVAAAGSGEGIALWDVASGSRLATLEGHEGAVTNLSFSPDAQTLLSTGADQTIRLWNVENTSEQSKLDFDMPIAHALFNPNGSMFALTQGKIARLIDAETLEELGMLELESDIQTITFNPDGSDLVIGDLIGGLSYWDTRSFKREVAINGAYTNPASLAFTPDGRLLAVGGFNGEINFWNVASAPAMMILEGTLTGEGGAVTELAFSPDSSLLVAANEDDSLSLWDVVGQKQVSRFEEVASQTVNSLAFSADGNYIAVDDSSNVRLWSLSDE
jgi:serine/threonine protein kinase/WD40 repeat protein